MTQSYFPNMPMVAPPHSVSAPAGAENTHKNEDVREAYVQHKNRLLHALDKSSGILKDMQKFNKDSWVVRYPHFREQTMPTSSKRPGSVRRSMSFADDPLKETEVLLSKNARSVSMASVPTVTEETSDDGEQAEATEQVSDKGLNFQILRLDLKLGPHGSSSSAVYLVSQLEKSSIANLLDDRINSSLNHMDKLRQRVEDTSSKVLVTGDLNAGKSTLVNALLRRTVMPVDQQPCTTAFCEVHDASENDGVEEVHVIKAGSIYDVKDESTFTRAKVCDLEVIISEDENVQRIIKVYIKDPRTTSQSFLNNGIADISLIDAPGLNRDSLKTTALFARQEEIDVVVFVVSAENHFTLSSKEFLINASNEKAYVFIVVNKYEQIKNKEKCRRLVLEQIKELSPRTYDDAEDLVHFVDAALITGTEFSTQAFDALELALRSFVLLKRSKSKLNPAATYLNHLLSDLDLLVGANAILAQTELDQAKDDLQKALPVLEKMKSGRDSLEEGLERVEETGASTASRKTKQILHEALERVGGGELAMVKSPVQMPSYPGLLAIWDYTRDVRRALLASVDAAVKLAEDEARVTTTKGVANVNALADKHLPEGVERSRRVFMPEAMFSRRRNVKGETTGAIVVAGGMFGLGIGLAQNSDLLETSLLDLFDIHHQFAALVGDKDKVEDDEDSMPSALGLASMGVGALTVVTGKTLGARGVLESVLRVSEIFGSPSARKWAGPVIGAFTIGLTVYFVLELPYTIPRTVGRRIKKQLLARQDGTSSSASSPSSDESAFIGIHANRVSRETRKVLRIASWDLRERFRGAMEERGKEVRNAEEVQKRAEGALRFFGDVQERAGGVREDVESVGAL